MPLGAYTSLYTALYVALATLVFPGSPANALGAKVELNLNGVWTDITAYVMLRGGISITNMGRADESSSISPCQLTLTLKNDGRFTPKLSSGAYFPYILRNTQIRVSVSATSQAIAPQALNLNTGFETDASNWTAESNATIARSTAQAHTGTASLSLHGNGTTANPQAESEKEPVTANASYTATAWFFNTATWASGVLVQINWYTAANTFISSNNNSAGSLPANTWTQVSVTATAPSNAAYGTITVRASGTPAAGNIFFVDDAALTSLGGVAYSGARFYGEVSSWPPGSDISGRDTYVTVTASGIWRRISQSSATIGSAYSRYLQQLTGTSVPATAWMMEDGNDSTAFVTTVGAGGAATFSTVAPSFAADGTSFPGCDALPQFNGARITAPVSSAATPTNNCIRFALSVPAGGDSNANGGNWNIAEIDTAGTFAKLEVYLLGNGTLQFDGVSSGGTVLFTTTTTTNVQGTPLLVSCELTPSGGSVNWALRIIKPSAGSILESKTGTRASSTIGAVSQVKLNRSGTLTDTCCGALAVFYAVPSITTAASAIGGWSGEFAVDRFTRLCGEAGIAAEVIGSASATMGPQADDTLAAILQSIEDTDGGLLFESRTQFGLGYRTLGSLQNQSYAATLSYAAGAAPGDAPQPAYDDQLLRNSVTIANYDGYAALAQLTSGAVSVQAVPNGVGVYAGTGSANATSHSQVNAIAQQKMFQGTVDDVRYPQITVNLAAPHAAPLFSLVPSLRVGDYFQLVNLPGTLGGSSTSKQLAWGYSETLNADNQWVITFNAVPELPFETTFSPGVYSVTQAPSGAVAAGSAVGSSVSGAQLGDGSVPASALSASLSARTIGGMTSFVSASTPYDWSFAVSGTPADVTYFIGTEVQCQPIAVGDTFSNTSGLGGPFTVTSVDPPSGGNVTVHFTPDASSVMSVGTVQGGKNGDTWVNTSGGNQVNIWAAGAWTPVTWTASSVLAASSITSSLIAAGSIIAGKIAAGAIDGMTITGATLVADGSSGEILVYSGTPATGNLIGSWSGASGSDGLSNSFPAGLGIEQGGLVLYDQGSAPATVTGASTIYTSSEGKLRYKSSSGNDLVLDRSVLELTNYSMGTQTLPHILSGTINYLANEAVTGSEYEIEVDGTITTPTSAAGTEQTFTWSFYLDGSPFSSGVDVTAGTVMLVHGQTFAYCLRFRATVEATGAGGTVTIAADGGITRKGVNLGNLQAGGGTMMSSIQNVAVNQAFDTTSNHSLAMYCAWGGGTVASGHSAITYRTKKTRRN